MDEKKLKSHAFREFLRRAAGGLVGTSRGYPAARATSRAQPLGSDTQHGRHKLELTNDSVRFTWGAPRTRTRPLPGGASVPRAPPFDV